MDPLDKLSIATFAQDLRSSIGPRNLESPRRERRAEHDFLGVLADIDESTEANDAITKTADVDVAVLVDLGKREERQIQSAPVIEVELIGLIDHGHVIGRRARLNAHRRGAADEALFIGQDDAVEDVFLGRDHRQAGGNPGPDIADGRREELEGGPPSNDLPRPEGKGRHFGEWNAELSRERRAVRREVRLDLGRVDNDEIDENPRNLHLLWRKRLPSGQALDLHHHDTAGAPRRLRHGHHLSEDRLLFHGHVPILIGRGPSEEAHVDVKGLVEHPFAAADRDDVHEVLVGRPRLLSAPDARIGVRVQPGMGDEPGPARRHLPHQLRERSLRQGVGLDEILPRHLLHTRRIHQRSRHDPLQQALVGKPADALPILIAEPHGMDDRDRLGRRVFEVPVLERGDE